MSGDRAAALLEVREISRRFGGYVALDQVSCAVEATGVHALIGPNGAGKTTLFNIISGLLTPHSGQLMFAGARYTGARPDRIIAMGIARNFQQVRLFPGLSVIENIMVGGHCRLPRPSLRDFLLGPFGFDRADPQARARAAAALEFVGFRSAAKIEPQQLTLVEQRRVEIARALVSDPKLLLLDEPAAGMNPSEVGQLGVVIDKIRQSGLAVLLVEHHMRLVMAIADRITVLNAGKVIASGAPQSVRENPHVIAAYLGDAG